MGFESFRVRPSFLRPLRSGLIARSEHVIAAAAAVDAVGSVARCRAAVVTGRVAYPRW